MGLITYDNLEDGEKVTANIFNERFAQIVAQLNGNIDENNLADDGISKEKLKAEVYESMYPVGSMYVNFTDNTDPATLLGFGVWQAVVGKFVAGYDGSQTEFNAAEKTGGHKKLQAHSHTTTFTQTQGGIATGSVIGKNKNDSGVGDATSTTGEGDGENLPPYIVGYVWKRTS